MKRYKMDHFTLTIRDDKLEDVCCENGTLLDETYTKEEMKARIFDPYLFSDKHHEEPSTIVYFTLICTGWFLIQDYNDLMLTFNYTSHNGVYYEVNIEDDLL